MNCGSLVAALLVFGGVSSAQTLDVLYGFTGGSDGSTLYGGLAVGAAGTLYGTTFGDYFGTGGLGTVFSLVPPASPGVAWTKNAILYFDGTDGCYPEAGVVIGSGGVLYGTTHNCGGSDSDFGAAYSLTPPASPGGAWTPALLYWFGQTSNASFEPMAPLVIGPGGVLYGTLSTSKLNDGAVFQLTPPASPGGAWGERTLWNFTIAPGNGTSVSGGVVIGANGTLYGTTESGGTGGWGTVYSLAGPASQGEAWTETTLFNFGLGDPNGSRPYSTVAIGSNGDLYGTTYLGGDTTGCGNYGCGTVFSLTPPASAGGAWAENVLYAFPASGGEGASPYAGVVIGKNGTLYGTSGGGAGGCGTIFSLTPSSSQGGAWTHAILHTFNVNGATDGCGPQAPLVFGANGTLYGTTVSGGPGGAGTVFSLTLP
jgi:uncharacterized repeat protein (TIGR03803 family)